MKKGENKMAKFARRLFAGALAAAVACTTVIGSDMTALAADKKAHQLSLQIQLRSERMIR